MSSSQKNVKGNGGAQISQNNKRQKNCACEGLAVWEIHIIKKLKRNSLLFEHKRSCLTLKPKS